MATAGNRRMQVPGVLVALLASLLASVLVMPVASADTSGLELRSTRERSPRLTELRVYSPALAHDASVRVLTPGGFDPDLDELRPFIEARYRTRTDRGGRAIAGLSMGGFGAMSYAARHPDVFGFAASFSGAVDLLHPGISGVVTISPLAHQGVPGEVFGLRLVDEAQWRAHNPVDLAANLRGVEIQLRTGNGQPGGRHGGSLDPQEMGVSQATATLHRRLDALGIPHLYDDYGPGAHTWPYWRDDLAATLPAVDTFFARAPGAALAA
jgi:esterase/lipase superfamily enzyme